MNEVKVTIHYCSQCRFILRASWMAQELLMTFPDEINELSLKPGAGGVFEILLNNDVIYSKREMGKFPESK